MMREWVVHHRRPRDLPRAKPDGHLEGPRKSRGQRGCTTRVRVRIHCLSLFSIRHLANWQCNFDIQTPSKSNSIDWWENVTRPKSTMGMTKTRLFWEHPQKGTKDICEQGQWQSHNMKRHVVITATLIFLTIENIKSWQLRVTLDSISKSVWK